MNVCLFTEMEDWMKTLPRVTAVSRSLGALQNKKIPKSQLTVEVGGWEGGSRSHSELLFLENRPKIAEIQYLVLILWFSSSPCVFCLHIHFFKVVSVSDGFPKIKFGWM